MNQTSFNFWTYFKYLFSKIAFVFVSPAKWPAMQSVNQKIEETQNQLNVDLILQKISFCQKAFQCLFTQEQMTLLLLQQKISIEDLKKQRLIMNIEDQRFLIKNNKQKTELNKQENKLNLKQTENSQVNQEEEDEVMANIFQAISFVEKNSKRGDQVSKKILDGLRSDVQQKYEAYRMKFKSMIHPQRPSMISRFIGNSKSTIKMPLNQLETNKLNYLSQMRKLSKFELDKIKSNMSIQSVNYLQTPKNRL